ncbi:hypothetical protein AQF52_3212 [Streptomyces venezuelae]|nr:hypothetical protein AQF52_3212 [Streptomyces venezuelae]
MPGVSTVPSSEALSPSAGPLDRPTAISSDVWLISNLHRTALRLQSASEVGRAGSGQYWRVLA